MQAKVKESIREVIDQVKQRYLLQLMILIIEKLLD